MGKSNKGAVGGAASGAAMGSSVMPGWGTAIGAVVGGVAGSMADTDGGTAGRVQQVDPAFMNSLYNQSMGTETTAADVKMKAAFDQTLAQQVAAARASRGVNPALMNRNVARLAQEAGAKAAQVGEEENLKNQADARIKYLTAINMNQKAQQVNSGMDMTEEERDSKRSGALLNSLAGAGETFVTADAASKKEAKEDARKDALNNALVESARKGSAGNSYTTGAGGITVPQYNLNAKSESDERAKTKIKKITEKGKASNDMVVMSDERQKDLIKTESLPANGNMGVQNQQAMQPQAPAPMAAPMQTPMMAAQQAPVAPQTPTSPAPVPASQTALGQANASLAKGGRIDDLALRDGSELVKPADAPDAQTLAFFGKEALRQETRNHRGQITGKTDKELYQQFLEEWRANNATQKGQYLQDLETMKTQNAGTNNERAARLSNFYTGTTAVNANDLAQRYAPKAISGPATDWQSVGDAARASNPNLAGKDGIGGVLRRTLSDERAKQDIKTEAAPQANGDSMNPKNFLDKLTAYSYEYKQGQKQNPNAGEGRYLSVMAQDLEKAGPVGQSMVQENEQGVKQVDYGKGFGAILAAQVQLNERLQQLESKKSKG